MNDATTPPGKPAKPKKEKAEKKEPTVRRSKFADIYPDDAKITVLAEKNPKKEGSAANTRFELYGSCATVKDFIAKAGNKGYSDIAYNVGRAFIKVG